MADSPSVTWECGSFDAAATLLGGQCFRWIRQGDRLCGTASGRYVEMKQDQGRLTVFGAEKDEAERVWRVYLDLERDYDDIRRQVIALEPRLEPCAAFAGGIHILAQEPWEALCAFVVSQNNNIPRIRGIVSQLCMRWGAPAIRGEQAAEESLRYAFPTPDALASATEAELRACGCGYRAPYLKALAQMAASGGVDFEAIRKAPIGEARERLRRLKGVGPKVAECALLYGFGRLECFPVDVWIRRALDSVLSGGTSLSDSPIAGVAQQYVFEYIRLHPEIAKPGD